MRQVNWNLKRPYYKAFWIFADDFPVHWIKPISITVVCIYLLAMILQQKYQPFITLISKKSFDWMEFKRNLLYYPHINFMLSVLNTLLQHFHLFICAVIQRLRFIFIFEQRDLLLALYIFYSIFLLISLISLS